MKVKVNLTIEFNMTLGVGYHTKKKIKSFILGVFIFYQRMVEQETSNHALDALRKRVVPRISDIQIAFGEIEKSEIKL